MDNTFNSAIEWIMTAQFTPWQFLEGLMFIVTAKVLLGFFFGPLWRRP